MSLVTELKIDHVEIASALQKARDLGVTTAAGQELLKSAKMGLLAKPTSYNNPCPTLFHLLEPANRPFVSDLSAPNQTQ